MTRTARLPRRLAGVLAFLWALLLALPAITWFRHESWTASVLVVITLGLLLISLLTLHAWVTRAAMDEHRIELHALRAKERLRVPLNEVTAYRMDAKGEWWVDTEVRSVRVAVREPWELHRAFVDFAPSKLDGRRKRFPGVSPSEEFVGLWTYDVEGLASRAVGTIAAFVLLTLIVRRASFGALGQVLGLLIAPCLEAWGRLDVTRESIVRRGPFHRQAIPWADVRAIFREGAPGDRSFVIVGPECAIHIPTHLAIDRDLIEKVLYSLPDPVLCVNFDETTLRGYKRRKKAKESTRQEDLLPALTACVP